MYLSGMDIAVCHGWGIYDGTEVPDMSRGFRLEPLRLTDQRGVNCMIVSDWSGEEGPWTLRVTLGDIEVGKSEIRIPPHGARHVLKLSVHRIGFPANGGALDFRLWLEDLLIEQARAIWRPST
jgi:hypothetical protein